MNNRKSVPNLKSLKKTMSLIGHKKGLGAKPRLSADMLPNFNRFVNPPSNYSKKDK